MEKQEAIRQYEYAKARIKQRRMVLFHLVVFVLGSVAIYGYNMWVQNPEVSGVWWGYVVGAWALLVFFHAINIYIVNRFMGKAWQEQETERLVVLQQQKIKELRLKVEKDYPLVDVQRDLKHNNNEPK